MMTDTKIETPTTMLPPQRGRRTAAMLLVIIGCVLAMGFSVSRLVSTYVFDTDEWVATVGPAIQDPAVSKAIATRAVDEAFAATDVQAKLTEAVEEQIPRVAPILVPIVVKQIRDELIVQVDKFIQSDTFRGWWESSNRVLHGQMVTLSRTTTDEEISKIALQTNEVTGLAAKLLAKRGIDLGAELPTDSSGNVVLLTDEKVANAQKLLKMLRWLEEATGILAALAMLAFLSAIAVSPRRLRTLRHGLIGIVIGSITLLLVYRLGTPWLADLAPRQEGKDALMVLLDDMKAAPVSRLRIVVVACSIAAIAVYMLERFLRSPSARTDMTSSARRAGSTVASGVRSTRSVASRHQGVARYLGPVVVAVWFVVGPLPSLTATIWMAVVAIGWVIAMNAWLPPVDDSTGEPT